MAREDVHFEIFLKRSRTAAWVLSEAERVREAAIERAKALLVQHPDGSVRVSKEIWLEGEGVFRAIAIFEAGRELFEDDGRADRKRDLPCVTPADLSSLHARQLISRVLADWLRRQTATAMDLLHRVDLVETLEATGTEYQHAVQKVAIAQASATESSVQHFVKQINDLLKRAVATLYAEHRAGAFEPIAKDGLAAACEKALRMAEPERMLRGRFVGSMKGAVGWSGKLTRALDFADVAVAGASRTAPALGPIGDYLGELLDLAEVRAVLSGRAGDELGEQVRLWTEVFAGRADKAEGLSEPGRRLTAHFANDRFDAARAALARAILDVLKGPKRLKPADVVGEGRLNRRLADTLIRTASPLLPAEDIIEAFVIRSRRLLEPEAIESVLRSAQDPLDAGRKLIALEDDLVGADNKAKLASYLRAHLGSNGVENALVYVDSPVLQRLSAAAELRKSLGDSGFATEDVAAAFEKLDGLAVAAEAKAKLFDRLATRAGGPIAGAHALLKLVAGGVIPAGPLSLAARRRAMSLLSSEEARAALKSAEPGLAALAREAAAWVQTTKSAA